MFHSSSVLYRSSHRRCSIKKGALKSFAKYTGKHLCQSLFFKIKLQAKAFEFCEIFKNTSFIEQLRWLLLIIA